MTSARRNNSTTKGLAIALTAIAFGIGLLIVPLGVETKDDVLPD